MADDGGQEGAVLIFVPMKMIHILFRHTLVFRTLNFILWFLFCAMAGTGFLLAYRLPHGRPGGGRYEALGLTRYEWGEVHTWLSWAFIVVIVLHLILHWRWLWQVASHKNRWALIGGMAGGVFLILLGWLAPVTMGGN